MDSWLKEKYRLHGKLPIYKRHISEAADIIKKALQIKGIWGLSCSGGKDSVVMLDICCREGWRGPVLHFTYPEMEIENTILVKNLAKKYTLDLHLLEVLGEWDAYEKVGHFFLHPETPEEKEAAREVSVAYKKKIAEYVKSKGWIGQFIGLSRHESRSRNMMLLKKRSIYQTNDRETWTACPLMNWSGADIWAYIFENNLPYLQCYDLATDPETERSEITWFIAESAWRHGMMVNIKKTKPDLFNQLAMRWPEIRRYV